MGTSSTTDPISIVCGTDEKYVLPTVTTVASLLSHLPADQPVNLFLLDGGITSGTKDALSRHFESRRPSVALTILTPRTELLDGVTTQGHLALAAYLRLFMAELLPGTVEKALYLDSDLIIRKNILPLWRTPLDGKPVAAVRDYGEPDAGTRFGAAHCDDLGLERGAKYCNSGVMLVHLPTWRALDIGRRAFEWLRKNPGYNRYADQDGLNATMAGEWVELPFEWNVQIGALFNLHTRPDSPTKQELEAQRSALLESGGILHYVGGRKPWDAGLTNRYYRLFLQSLRSSGWLSRGALLRWQIGWLNRAGRAALASALHKE